MTPLQEFGVSVEDQVVYKLHVWGYNPEIPVDRLSAGADLTIADIPIHVKAARRKLYKHTKETWKSRYQFNLSNIDLEVPGFVILVCVMTTGNYYYIIPTWECKPYVKIIAHPRQYKGWASKYLNAWHLIRQVDGFKVK